MRGRVLPAGLPALTLAAFWRTLPSYFLSDDFVLLRHARSFHGAWLPLFTTAGGDGFFRPIGYLTLYLTSAWAGASPLRWHIAALALHSVNVVLVFFVSKKLLPSRFGAGFAAALFAIHGTRPEVAVWVAGRFDLLATGFALAGLLLFLRSQDSPQPAGHLYATAALACMCLGILSKESAYVFPVLLLLLGPKRRSDLLPFFAGAAALFTWRWCLLGGIGGYRDAFSGQPQIFSLGFRHSAQALLLRAWGVMFFPINWSADVGKPLALLLLLYLAALACLAAAKPYRRPLVFGLGFAFLAALPPLSLLLIGPDLGKSRILYLPSVGFCIALAAAVAGLKGRPLLVVPAVILAFHLAVLEHNLECWLYASRHAQAACAAAARGAVTPVSGTLRGVPYFANGFRECVELQSRVSIQ